MKIKIDKKVFLLTKVQEKRIDNELILYSEKNKKIYSLNETAAIIWKLICKNIEGIITKKGIEEYILKQYTDIGIEEVKKDVEDILNEFIMNGLLMPTED